MMLSSLLIQQDRAETLFFCEVWGNIMRQNCDENETGFSKKSFRMIYDMLLLFVMSFFTFSN